MVKTEREPRHKRLLTLGNKRRVAGGRGEGWVTGRQALGRACDVISAGCSM